ncbi:hypothetical protein COT78_02355 [Candidatus Berkelbacteria bacterium CG10_big_fil_rev_8_21_14_0_10_43_13]|uniref:Cell division protein FtsX n=1 Tax=Candidatus Berkelbacteria bacterium CG10_big_fil_rev_8_21_14_0_10_43_13 TaxID=1974514 RepID=A0A2H0W6G0_9BACT|nr:MAG: hypothetical protein COT78_02355 [Candidatus Berkelbacteria bacterium CG10_big_fil_rev_8_21_14_0_10_43_13]
MQLVTTLRRITKTALVSLWRNRWLSLAATLVMVLTLFTVSFFVCLMIMVNSTTSMLRSKVDISVYFNDSVSNDQIFKIENTLLARSDVKSVTYVSKEKALEIWKSQNSDNTQLRDIISTDYNPLPRSLEIKTEQTEDLDAVNTFLSSKDYKPLIKEISYRKNKDLVDRLIKITNFIKYVGWTLSILFVVISVLIIYNTIRLTIYARCEEIDIMKLVGAGDWYVQGPFILEGVAYGVAAAIFSSLILYLTAHYSLPAAGNYLGIVNIDAIVAGISFWTIILSQLIVGVVLGTVCSVWAVKKHLK